MFAADSRLLGFFFEEGEGEGEGSRREVLILFFCSFSLFGEIEGINWER